MHLRLLTYSAELVRLSLLETRQLHAELAPMADAARAEQASGHEQPNAALAARIVTHHLQAYRNKRCLLVYHRERLDWLRARVWDKAGALALVLNEDRSIDPSGAASIRTLFDPAELEWLRSYAALVALYKDAFLDVLDVTWPLSQSSSSSTSFDRPSSSSGPGSASTSRARQALCGGFDVRSDAAYATTAAPNSVRPPDDVMIYVLVTRNVSDVETERGTIHLRVGERLYVRRDEVEALLLRGWLREIDP